MKPDPRAEKPARRIQKRGKIQKAHRLSGRKVRGVVVVETALEATAALGAELDPRVIRWRPQPFTVDLFSGETAATKDALLARFRDSREKPRPYTPDHLFCMRDVGDIIVECKHTHWIRKNSDVIESSPGSPNSGSGSSSSPKMTSGEPTSTTSVPLRRWCGIRSRRFPISSRPASCLGLSRTCAPVSRSQTTISSARSRKALSPAISA